MDHATMLLRERALILRLAAGIGPDPQDVMSEILALCCEATGARSGLLAFQDPGLPAEARPRWRVSHGEPQGSGEALLVELRRGLLAEAETSAQGSVLSLTHRIISAPMPGARATSAEIVLCGATGPARAGLIYLTGVPKGPSAERALASLLDGALSLMADRLLARLAGLDGARHAPSDARTGPVDPVFDGIVGTSGALRSVLAQARHCLGNDASILITGPTGTGKTALARAIHRASRRRDAPFMELSCAALPAELFESELFGHVVGAHSTAMSDRPGKVEGAEGGTLFLDEIGELPLSCQAKLLQFVQSLEYLPLGGNARRKANIRIIAATNVDLDEAVRERRFRSDLLHRLRVLHLPLPALQDRVEDIPLLVGSLGRRHAERHEMVWRGVTLGALGALLSRSWQGNIRELSNVIERGVLLSGGHDKIGVHHLFFDAEVSAAAMPTWEKCNRDFQRSLLQVAIDEAGGNISQAARALGLSRSHVYNLIDSLGLRSAGTRSAV